MKDEIRKKMKPPPKDGGDNDDGGDKNKSPPSSLPPLTGGVVTGAAGILEGTVDGFGYAIIGFGLTSLCRFGNSLLNR